MDEHSGISGVARFSDNRVRDGIRQVELDFASTDPGDVVTVCTENSTWHFITVKEPKIARDNINGVAIQTDTDIHGVVTRYPKHNVISRIFRVGGIIFINNGRTGVVREIILNSKTVS